MDPTFSVLARISTFPALAQILLFPGTHPDPFSVLTRTLLRYSPRFHLSGTFPDSTLSRYSPGFHLSDTSSDSTFPGTCSDLALVLAQISTFPALTRILPFFGTCSDFYFSDTRSDSTLSRYSPGPSPVLTRISPFWHSPGSHLSSTRSNPTFSVLTLISTFPALAQILPFPGTHSDPSPVLARIPPFRYSPGSHLSGTRPNSTFPKLAQISTFPALARILPFLLLARIHPSLVLARIPLFRYSPGFHLSDTRSDFYFFGTLQDSTFSGTHLDPTFFGTLTFPNMSVAHDVLMAHLMLLLKFHPYI